jgi:site-specific DNA-methyltransferase (adenine-specific)
MRAMNSGKQMKSVWTLGAPGRQEKIFGKHPTQKPIALLERCILSSTHESDLILDPFSGSGTTGIACLRTNRRFIGIEIEEDYVALSKARFGAATSEIETLF